MTIIILILLIICSVGIISCLINIFDSKPDVKSFFSWHSFIKIIVVYLTSILAFSTIYLGVHIIGIGDIIIHNATNVINKQDTLEEVLLYIGNIIYFSSITMLTVGYGDITPIGASKIIAVIQALIGYLIPVGYLISGLFIVYDTSMSKQRDVRRAKDFEK